MSGSHVWIEQLFAAVKPVIPAEFVGRIEINAFKGGITNIKLEQSFKAVVEATTPK